MKYFTTDWWFSDCEDSEAVFAKYDSYFASISSSLPPALLEFKELHTLHDAEVKVIRSDFEKKNIAIEFNGWDIDLSYPVRYVLQFSGVSQFDQILPEQDYVESELGDLGYWEIEMIGSGIEMRMLFVSTAEFRILFSGFNYTHESLRA